MHLQAVRRVGATVQETCAICGTTVPFGVTAHVLIHTNTDAGVVDHYVCHACYDEQLAPLFDAPDVRE